MQFNTLYQLLAMKLAGSPLLEMAETLLMMPDLFHWLLTGEKCNEFTEATTTQFYNPVERRLGHGAVGEVRAADRHSSARSSSRAPTSARCCENLAAESGLAGGRRRAARLARHGQRRDGRAGRQPPGQRPDWCYISLGTWALMGDRVARSRWSTTRCCELNFTNEGGRGRHDPPAEEHHRAVAGAGVPPGVGAAIRVRLGRSGAVGAEAPPLAS